MWTIKIILGLNLAGVSLSDLPRSQFCASAIRTLQKIEALSREQIQAMTEKEYNELVAAGDALVKDPKARAILTARIGTVNPTQPTQYVVLKDTATKPKVRYDRLRGRVIQISEPTNRKAVYWPAVESWRDRLFAALSQQTSPPPSENTALPEMIEYGLSQLKTPQGREETAVWFSDRFAELPTPNWFYVVSEARERNLNPDSVPPALQQELRKWAHDFSGDWKQILDPDDRLSFAGLLNQIKVQTHPLVQEAIAADPALLPAFDQAELAKLSKEEIAKVREEQTPRARRILETLRSDAIRELILTMASSIETFAVPAKRKRDGDWILIHKSVQIFISLNPDGSIKSLRFKFFEPDVLVHYMSKAHRGQNFVQSSLETPDPHGTRPQTPKSTREERMAAHANGWKLSSRVLADYTVAGLIDLGKEFPEQHNFIETVVLKAMEENADLFNNGYTQRFIRKIRAVVQNDEGLDANERRDLISAMLRSKRRSLAVEKARAEAPEGSQGQAEPNGFTLADFVSGERGLAELKENHVYEFQFLRNPQMGTQRVVFHRRALKFIQDDTHDLSGIYWLKMLERGIVADTGMGGVKHRNWTNEVPFEWEIKRIRQDWRLLMFKDSDGIWHVDREHLEH